MLEDILELKHESMRRAHLIDEIQNDPRIKSLNEMIFKLKQKHSSLPRIISPIRPRCSL